MGSVSLHPFKAEILSCSGSRHLSEPAEDVLSDVSSDSDADSNSSSESERDEVAGPAAVPAFNTLTSWLKVHAFDTSS